MKKGVSFIKEVYEELVKVAWPTREQTIRYTVLVIIVTLVVGVFLGGFDYILTAITAFILEHYGR
ncbi:preprotein translocase subunit SecE [Candidatus Daviesbacteria bacterium]|nr:preprotein translocase subunit SecE [Candidatus Daviesbacteria bacterium]